MASGMSQRAFLGGTALLFVAGISVTILWCDSMSAMGGMPMPGGWTMSMTWMHMPGQSWSDAATSFLGMWVAMMVTMMLPSLTPLLWRYRRAVGATDHLGRLTALARAVPVVAGIVVTLAPSPPTPLQPGDTACASGSSAPPAAQT